MNYGRSMHIKYLKISLKITRYFIKIQTKKKRKKGTIKLLICVWIFFIYIFILERDGLSDIFETIGKLKLTNMAFLNLSSY